MTETFRSQPKYHFLREALPDSRWVRNLLWAFAAARLLVKLPDQAVSSVEAPVIIPRGFQTQSSTPKATAELFIFFLPQSNKLLLKILLPADLLGPGRAARMPHEVRKQGQLLKPWGKQAAGQEPLGTVT